MTPDSLPLVFKDFASTLPLGFGLRPDKLPWVLYGWCFSALLVFLIALIPKWQMMKLSAHDNRFEESGKRIWNTIIIAFAQTKMFKDRNAGWMHALIFWGFLILLLRALQFFVIGLFPESQEFLLMGNGLVFTAYGFMKDITVGLVALATLYALYRRLVVRPKRLTLSDEGLAILGLILLIMISDLGFDMGHQAYIERSGSGSLLMNVSYWTHIITILVFLNVLPRSKHFHIITSIPNVYFSNAEGKGNQLHRLDFEAEDQESFGVTKIEEFTWKNMLDFHTCTECGRCDVFCPALNSDKPLSPKQLTVDLREHMNRMTPILIGANKDAEERPALMGDVIQDETIWSCTTCGACEEECPVMIEYVNKIIGLRQGMVMMDNRYPEELTQAFKSLETHSNPWGFPASQRTDWAEGLDVPIWDKENPTEYLYFVGCNGSFDQRGKSISRATVSALQKASVSFSILGDRESCTGDPARRLGNEYLFDMLASANAETLKEERVQKVIVHCPHCFNSFANEYPEFSIKLEVIHHSQLLEQLMADGKLKSEGQIEGSVVVHDSCYMGRHNKEYDAPRNVLAEVLQKDAIKEVETSRERGSCCGAGGGRFLLEENTGTRMSHNRLDELLEAEADTIAVSCPYCVLMLEDAAKSKGQSVKVRDISELLNE